MSQQINVVHKRVVEVYVSLRLEFDLHTMSGPKISGFGQSGLCQPAEPTAWRRGELERAGTLFTDAERSVGPRGAPKPGSVSPALFHGEKERLKQEL